MTIIPYTITKSMGVRLAKAIKPNPSIIGLLPLILVAALGIGLASYVPGRSLVLDAFGLIAFACLFPIISVLAYGTISEWRAMRKKKGKVL